jgi:hypothetical protein
MKSIRFCERVAFDVVFALGPGLQQFGQFVHVVGPDVARIGPGVHGNALRSRLQAQQRRTRDAGNAQVPRVAHQRHLVDVDRQRGAGMG